MSNKSLKYGIHISTLLAISIIIPTLLYANHSININTADKEALMTLNGIGEVKAQAIIDYRTANGPFAKIEDIQNVSGIGPATYANIKDHITVDGTSGQQNQSQNNAGEQAPPPPPPPGEGSLVREPYLFADAGKDRTVIAGADAIFEGKVYTKDGESLGSTGTRFLWNFGDGKTAEGPSVMHGFAHAGRYVVTLDVSTNRDSASHRIIVTSKPATFTLSYFDDGSAVIENKTNFDLDLSYWHVRSGEKLFTIPENTIVLTQEKMIVPPASLGFSVGSGWELLYPNGEVAGKSVPAKPVIVHAPAETTKRKPKDQNVAYMIHSPSRSDLDAIETTSTQAAVVSSAIPDANEEPTRQNWLNTWTIGFAALIALGAAGAFIASRANRKEWDIQEDVD